MGQDPAPSPGRGRIPLWRHVRDDLRARLAQGEFVDSFPGENELAARYGVSRHTIREALRELRDEGLVTAAKGRRQRPAGEAVIDQPVGALYSLFASVEAAGLEQRSIVRTLDIRADAHVAVRLGLEESTPLLYLERIRLADGEPLAHDKVWLPASDARALLDADFGHTALYDELADRCGLRLVGGEERIQAVTPTAAEQRLLGLPDGVAAFSIERLGRTHGRTVEWRTTLIRGDRFSVVTRFDARAGYRLDPAGSRFTHSGRSVRRPAPAR
ncbi:GntR family transcriptional regulator [Streptomyces sp. MMG1121]|uniref:GntR family transcriptional regulator n=1 Tax=Streptomyces sp. MMG1121 TaxID=1415544 RepID=UPI0006AFCD79|nr:GntR family transcriptional regulator [Streptomyces sp. MMG1121]KOV56230.1 GntR family transcriptional regulator [Streptomyces sp. MMG1121]